MGPKQSARMLTFKAVFNIIKSANLLAYIDTK
jgi:hypothetical protein